MTETRTRCTLGRACEPRNLAEAVHCVARHSAISTHELADRLGIDYGRLVKWTEPNGRCTLPGRLFGPLAIHTGRADHIAWVAREAGLLVAEPAGPAHTDDPSLELLDIVERLGRLAAADRDAHQDGVPSDQEIASLLSRAQQLALEVRAYERALLGRTAGRQRSVA